MKILFLIEGYEFGGVAAAFAALAKHLENDGHTIGVLLSDRRQHRPDLVAIPHRYIVGWTPPRRKGRLGRFVTAFDCLSKWKFYFGKASFSRKWDCFVLYHGKDFHWRWFLPVPSVLWFHEFISKESGMGLPPPPSKAGPVTRLVYRSLLRAVRGYGCYIAVTEQSAESARGYYDLTEKPLVIGNLIDVDRLRSQTEAPQVEMGREPGVANLLFVGRLDPPKGVDRLLTALSRIRGDVKPFRLWIVGDGVVRGDLEDQARTLGLGDDVRFLGAKTDPRPFYRKADLLVLPSRHEGMGLVLWESLLSGTRVLATDCGGTRDALRNGAWGKLVENSTDGLECGLREFFAGALFGDIDAAQKGIEAADLENRRKASDLFRSLVQ